MSSLSLSVGATPRAPAITERTWLAVALLIGLAWRLQALRAAAIEHPDEIFQYLEQTHRLLFGQGVIPWEYRYGMRGGLLPLLLAPSMWLGALITPAAPLWTGPRLMFTVLSLVPIAAAWAIGRRTSPTHATFAALAMAVAPDLVHFAPHTLAEPMAIVFLLAGAALAGESARPRILVGGVMLALGACIRFQYAPAALILAIPALQTPSRAALLSGGALGLVASAVADIAIGVTPFAWIGANVSANLLAGRSAIYGTAPSWAYLQAILNLWGVWAGPLLLLAFVGARGRWPLAAAAAVTFALHMLIPHKEYRFILLASALLTLLAAFGTADLVQRATRWTIGAAALWLLASATVILGGRAAALSPDPSPGQSFFAALRADRAACGIALWHVHWSGTTGYVGLHRPLPIAMIDTPDIPIAATRAFNRLIVPEATQVSGFATRTCDGHGACLLARPGGCAPAPASILLNNWLREHDQ